MSQNYNFCNYSSNPEITISQEEFENKLLKQHPELQLFSKQTYENYFSKSFDSVEKNKEIYDFWLKLLGYYFVEFKTFAIKVSDIYKYSNFNKPFQELIPCQVKLDNLTKTLNILKSSEEREKFDFLSDLVKDVKGGSLFSKIKFTFDPFFGTKKQKENKIDEKTDDYLIHRHFFDIWCDKLIVFLNDIFIDSECEVIPLFKLRELLIENKYEYQDHFLDICIKHLQINKNIIIYFVHNYQNEEVPSIKLIRNENDDRQIHKDDYNIIELYCKIKVNKEMMEKVNNGIDKIIKNIKSEIMKNKKNSAETLIENKFIKEKQIIDLENYIVQLENELYNYKHKQNTKKVFQINHLFNNSVSLNKIINVSKNVKNNKWITKELIEGEYERIKEEVRRNK